MRDRKRLFALVLAVCLLASSLPLPAVAEETVYYCGQHVHEDLCYTTTQTCQIPEHGHTEACTQVRTLSCGLTEVPAHTHGDGCYEGEALTCTLTQAHDHGDACTVEGALTCGHEAAHTHADGCYTVTTAECTQEVHTHDPAQCSQRTLTCGVESDHTHTPECQIDPAADCNLEETCTATQHKEGCRKAAAEAEAAQREQCTQQDDCQSQLHKDDCRKAQREQCDQQETCAAALHKSDCLLAINTLNQMIGALPSLEDAAAMTTQEKLDAYDAFLAVSDYADQNGLTPTEDQIAFLTALDAELNKPTTGDETDYAWYTTDFETTADETKLYKISSIKELQELAELTRGNVTVDGTTYPKTDFKGTIVQLTDSLNFEADEYWYYQTGATISDDHRIGSFAGTFDGNGKTITGLKFYNDNIEQNPYMYLFEKITADGTVKNLTLDTVTANINGYDYFGFIARELYGTATNCHVRNVTVNVAVNNANKGYAATSGGMFGYIESATVDSCTATNVKMTFSGVDNTDRVGALIGQAAGKTDSRSTIKNCHVYGATFDCSYKTKHFGAFVGQTKYTDVTDCTISDVSITTQDWSYNTGGFVGNVDTGSVYKNCTVKGFKMVDKASGQWCYSGNIGGFAGYVGGTGISFTGCSATGLDFDLEFSSDYSCGVGGFVGQLSSNGATITGCSASGNINAHSAGNADIPVGGFIGESHGGLKVSNCSTSVNVTAPEVAGGFVGACNKGTDVYTDCEATGSVTGTEGVAGGMVGYIMSGATLTFEDCTPAPSVTGPITNEVAYAQDKIYDLSSNGTITSETAPSWVCSVKLTGSYTIGYLTIQDAVDAGATTITLLQDVTENFILNGVDHHASTEQEKNFVLNMGDYTFQGIVDIYHNIAHFTANGTSENSSIKLTAPRGEHDIFNGWCKGTGTEGGEPSESVSYAQKTDDGQYWILERNICYHTHFTPTGYKEINAADRHLDFGTIKYGDPAPEAKTITFEYKGEAENKGIKGFETNDYFTFEGIGTLTAKIRPSGLLEGGVYDERIYVIMHDGSSHELWAKVIVSDIPSQVDPLPEEDADPDTPVEINATYGDTITLAVKISKAQTKARTTPVQDQVTFWYGDTQLGEAKVTYSDSTQTTGTASLKYDTTAGGIPTGTGRKVTAKYSGGLALRGSDGTITVNLSAKPFAAGETQEINGIKVTAPASYDKDYVYIADGGTIEVNNETFTVESGTVTLSKDATQANPLNIPKGATVTTSDGATITGPATVSKDGTVTVATGGSITPENGTPVTVTKGPVTAETDGSVNVPDDSTVKVGDVTVTGPADVAADGTVTVNEGGSATIGGTTITANPDSFTVKADGTVEVPTGTTVKVGDTTVEGPAAVDKDGNMTVTNPGTVTVDGTTVKPTTGPVTVKGDGTVEIPEDSTADVNGSTVTGPASVGTDGDVDVATGGSITTSDGVTVDVTKGPATLTDDGTVEVPEGSTVEVGGQTITGPASVDTDGDITVETGGKIKDGDKEYTVTDGPVTVEDGKITVPDGSSVNDGKTTIAGPTTVDPDSPTQDLPTGSSTNVGGTKVTVEEGKVTENEDGTITVPEDTTIDVGGQKVTGPAIVETNGDVTVGEGGTIKNGDTTVEVTDGTATRKPDGTVEVPADSEINFNGTPITGPATVSKDGQSAEVEKGGSFTVNGETYTVTEGTATVNKDGTVYVPEGSTITAGGKSYSGPLKITKKGISIFYKFLRGTDQVVTQGEEGHFRASMDYEKFTDVLIDGKKLSSRHYEHRSGSTVIILKPSYTESLKPRRTYTLTVLANDGEAETTFRVKAASGSSDQSYDSDSPQTGDTTNQGLWMAIACIGIAGLLASLLGKKYLLRRK